MFETVRTAVLLVHPGSDVCRALRHHLGNLLGALERIESISIVDVETKLKELLPRVASISEDDLDDAAAAELKQSLKLGCEKTDYAVSHELLTDSYCSLLALESLVRNRSRDEILRRLTGDPWFIRHEVLTRWGWMCCHRAMLEKGEHLVTPYHCKVAPRSAPGRGTDREFHTLLRFLHWLRLLRGDSLLFVHKREAPDFLVEDEKTAQHVGIEVTEAPQSPAWADAQDLEAAINTELKTFAVANGITVHVRDRSKLPDLHGSRDRIETIAKLSCAVRLKLTGLADSRGEALVAVNGLRLVLTIAEAAGRGPRVWWESSSSGPEIREEERALVASISQRISKKQAGTAPAIRPCHLVLYPNVEAGVDLGRAVEEVKTAVSGVAESRFDFVWMAGERFFDQIWPAPSQRNR